MAPTSARTAPPTADESCGPTCPVSSTPNALVTTISNSVNPSLLPSGLSGQGKTRLQFPANIAQLRPRPLTCRRSLGSDDVRTRRRHPSLHADLGRGFPLSGNVGLEGGVGDGDLTGKLADPVETCLLLLVRIPSEPVLVLDQTSMWVSPTEALPKRRP